MAPPPSPRSFGILGSGSVGQVLASGLKAHGYEVRVGTRSPGKLADWSAKSGIAAAAFSEVAAWADAAVLAVAGRVAAEAIGLAGPANLRAKLVIDVTNPIAEGPPKDGVLRFFTGPNESLMERLQTDYPDIHFVKAFNSVGTALMVNPKLPGGKPTMFYCGNDSAAKAAVARVIDQFGWAGEDMGTATAAGPIEALCQLWCIPGFLKNDWVHAFQMVRPGSR